MLSKLGEVNEAYVVGDYAKGIDSGIIDVVIIGQVDVLYLAELIQKAEGIIKRKIRSLVLSPREKKKYGGKIDLPSGLLVWSNEK